MREMLDKTLTYLSPELPKFLELKFSDFLQNISFPESGKHIVSPSPKIQITLSCTEPKHRDRYLHSQLETLAHKS